MIKKFKNINITLPPLRITLDDIYAIINIIKINNLGSVKIFDEKDNIIDINKINKNIIFYLRIEVLAENRRNDFKICFKKDNSEIFYYYDIDTDNLFFILKIERMIKEKRLLVIPKNTRSKIQGITSIFLMIFFGLSPLIKNFNNLFLNIMGVTFFFLIGTFYFLDFNVQTIIIIKSVNKIRRFYYKHYSIISLTRAILAGIIIILILFFLDKYSKH